MARRQLTLDNTVAAELAGSEDAVLRALRGHLDCDLHLRGNVLTLDGDDGDVQTAATVVDELVELIEQGHEIAPGTIEAVTGALDAHESPAEILEDVVWRHRNTKVAPKTVNQKRYVDSIRDHTITFGIGPAGTGKTFLAVAMAAAALAERQVQRIILTRPAVEAGERLGFLPGDIQAKVDPYLRPALRRALRHARPRPRQRLLRARRDRGRAAGVHARPHAQRLLRDPRRGPEHQPRADEDVPDPARLQLEDGRHRRHHPDRPARAISAPGWSSCATSSSEVEDISFIHFGGEDVVRHKLVQRIVAAYGEHAERERPARTVEPRPLRRARRAAAGVAAALGGRRRRGRPPGRRDGRRASGCAS